ncbi:hypothetical protein ACHAXR_008006, partial [Thalassiosira sp. AJA248-18]
MAEEVAVCAKCYYEVKPDNVEMEMDLGYKFSERNGYGTVPSVPCLELLPATTDANVRRSVQLHELLSSFTPVEEAAIRRITPLASIVKLAHGNIGTKGNISCVWQQSSLGTVLPNLPQDCRFIVIVRQQGTSSQLKSTKFNRAKIQLALQLLKETGLEAWSDIEISEHNLNQWPESGDLCDHLSQQLNLVVLERDEEGELYVAEDNVGQDNNNSGAEPVQVLRDGNDIGPAPLQNDVVPDEVYEAVVNIGEQSEVGAENALLAADAVNDAVQRIRGTNPTSQLNANANDPPPTTPLNVNGLPPPPQPQLNANGTEATFQQRDVLPTDGFVNMNTTRYAWARAFPTVFIPRYASINGEMCWRIFHDWTAWEGPRDKDVDFNSWCEYQMWRSDGVPASHPTFALVLYNHKLKNSLQGQGRFVVQNSGVDMTTTCEDIRNAPPGHQLRKQIDNLLKAAHIHTANVPGTDAYWRARYHEFKATSLYQSEVDDKTAAFFHTASIAEYHDYNLRLLLSKYTKNLTNVPEDLPDRILTDQSAFTAAVQSYKQIVTHYFASKLEIWFALFMKPVMGVDQTTLSKEFAPTRGGIHTHSTNTSSHPAVAKFQEYLRDYAESADNAFQLVNQFIENTYSSTLHAGDFPTQPHTVFHNKSHEARKEFCSKTRDGEKVWSDYEMELARAHNECSMKVGSVLQSDFGYNACHTGNPPSDWVKPGGLPDQGYRPTSDDMQRSQDIKERRELKKQKWQSELRLFERNANYINHVCTHKCSDYCLKEKMRQQLFNADLHADINPRDTYEASSGEMMFKSKFYDCRMGFGEKLPYDHSGENNFTRGIPPRIKPNIKFDDNGQPKYEAVRNHPRRVQGPHAASYFGANTDTQVLLVANKVYPTDRIAHENLSNNLVAAGLGGLDHNNSLHILVEYLTKYKTKGGASSKVWETASRSITEEYVNRNGNNEKTILSLVGRHMGEITNSMSVPKDQACFCLAGGKMTRNTIGSTFKCSVNATDLSSLGATEAGEGEAVDSSFTWDNVVRRYKTRPDATEDLNVYHWVAKCWRSNKRTPPQFFGYDNTPTWPLSETFSKWTLTLYRPWRQSPDETKANHESFKAALEDYLCQQDCRVPDRVLNAILRVKRGEMGVNAEESEAIGGAPNAYTPTTDQERRNATHDLAGEAANISDRASNDEEFEDMTDELFNRLRSDAPVGHNWSDNYSVEIRDSLRSTAKDYYERQRQRTIDGNTEHEQLELFDEHIYQPRNAKTDGQKFLVYHNLYHHYLRVQHKQGHLHHPPPTQLVKVEGLPGVGKTFIILTLRNIARRIEGRNNADLASTPTGCSAFLIHGSTHYRLLSISAGKKEMKKPPTTKTSSNALEVAALTTRLRNCEIHLMDEDSMNGRPLFAHITNRHCHTRREGQVIDQEGNSINPATSGIHSLPIIPQNIATRPHGGIPMVYSLGDCNQLPPVGMA